MLSYTPIKEDNPKPFRRVNDLNLKLVTLFDVYDEQQNMIKELQNKNLKSVKVVKGTESNLATPKKRTVRYYSQVNLTKVNPLSSRGQTPDLHNFNIASITGRFSEYRLKTKNFKTENDMSQDYQTSEEGRFTQLISTTPPPKGLFFDEKHGISENKQNVHNPQDPTKNGRAKIKLLSQKKEDTGFRLDSGAMIHNFTQKVSVLKTINEPAVKYEAARHMDLSEDKHQLKLKGPKKLEINQDMQPQSFKVENQSLFHPGSSSRKKSIYNEAREKTVQIVTHLDRGTSRSTKKIEACSTLKDPKVTNEQKQKLSDFLKNEFVDEIITNKHQVQNIYDGEAFTSLNNLKKIINSHSNVRNSMYGASKGKKDSQSINSENSIKDDFPPDVPRLKQFVLSEPEDTGLVGIRPRSFISPNNGDYDRRSSIISQSGENQALSSQAEERSKNNFKSLKDAIGIQKARGKRIRTCIRDKLLKYHALGVSLKDLRENKDIFPAKPYEKNGSYPFIRAVKAGDCATVKAFLEENKFFVFEYDPVIVKQTALHWAAKRGHTKICTLLLDYGADPDAEDMGGKTPLYYALKEKQPEIVGRLLFSKASPWSSKNINYKQICEDGASLRYLNKARQLAILLLFYCARDRASVWEKEAKALVAPIETLDPTYSNDNQQKKQN